MDKAGGFATPDPNTLALALAQIQSPILSLIRRAVTDYGIYPRLCRRLRKEDQRLLPQRGAFGLGSGSRRLGQGAGSGQCSPPLTLPIPYVILTLTARTTLTLCYE